MLAALKRFAIHWAKLILMPTSMLDLARQQPFWADLVEIRSLMSMLKRHFTEISLGISQGLIDLCEVG